MKIKAYQSKPPNAQKATMPSKMVWYLMARILSKPFELRKAQP